MDVALQWTYANTNCRMIGNSPLTGLWGVDVGQPNGLKVTAKPVKQ